MTLYGIDGNTSTSIQQYFSYMPLWHSNFTLYINSTKHYLDLHHKIVKYHMQGSLFCYIKLLFMPPLTLKNSLEGKNCKNNSMFQAINQTTMKFFHVQENFIYSSREHCQQHFRAYVRRK